MDSEEQGTEHRQPKKAFLRYIWYGFAGLVVVAAVVGVVLLARIAQAANAPIRTSDHFIRELLSNQVDVAYDLTSDEFKTATSHEAFAQVADTASKTLKVDSLKLQSGKMEDDPRGKLATIVYEIKDETKTYDLTVRAIKVADKDWLIDTVNNELKQ